MSRHIKLNLQGDALERVLRVLRHRGYSYSHLQANPGLELDSLEVKMEISGSRPLWQLASQLAKVEQVRSLSLHDHSVRLAL